MNLVHYLDDITGSKNLTAVSSFVSLPSNESKVILSIRNLSVEFITERGTVHAVRGLDLDVREGEILGLVGESGCGKSVTLMSILNLISAPGRIISGTIKYKRCTDSTVDLLTVPREEMRTIRGKEISMVFQDPASCLNPAYKIERQITEALSVHGLLKGVSSRERRAFLIDLLSQVGIKSPETVLDSFPHQLSGGMQQRVVIAIAIVTDPKLILMDEPTTALDVTIQAQILQLIKNINRRKNTAIVFVTHDLSVAYQLCDRIAVMYAGQIVEEGPAADVVTDPMHPYTRGLLGSIPTFEKGRKLRPIPGQVPDLTNMPVGCSFHPRCPYARTSCASRTEELLNVGFGDAGFRMRDSFRKVRCRYWPWIDSLYNGEAADETAAPGDEE